MQMRTKNWGALAAICGLWMCVTAQAEAGCDTAGCKAAVLKTASTGDKPIVLSKFKKQDVQAPGKAKPKLARRGHGAQIADAAARGRSDKSGLPKLPASVANARAELTSADPRIANDEARNLAATDDNEIVTMNGVQIASADQLNDIDRAVASDTPEVKSDDVAPVSPAPVASGSGRIVRAVPAGERHVVTNSGDADPWGKTSLIGKIFIAFGSVLTLASAARLVIA